MNFSLKNEISSNVIASVTSRMDNQDSALVDWASTFLKIEALKSGNKTVFRNGCNGAVEDGDRDKFLAVIELLKNSFQLIEMNESNCSDWDEAQKMMVASEKYDSLKVLFISSETYIHVSLYKKDASITIEGFDREKVKEVVALFNPLLKKKSQRKGRVCGVLKSMDSIVISDLGVTTGNFTAENYESKVVEDYKFLVKDLASKTPRGRLVVLNGKPGGGKSYFVRGLINDVENVVFVVVPSSLIGHLSDPSFMPAILSLQEEEKSPIILILEDADAALLPRGTDNMSTISDLLNYADGIIGNIVDMRIIATTNAKKMEIEPALLRKGRLSREINISHISPEQAKKIFARLVEEELNTITNLPDELNKPMILADIYDLAWTHREKREKNE
jgi:SpoVK/Ycf46/Vps4 family AAA+-type ATPase